jgi:ribose transport system ATP-binding protein
MAFAVHNLKKSYGGVEVLRGVDLEVADGEMHALLGANGAGKSTLIKCLSGAIAPDDGVMMVGSRRYDALTPRQAQQAGVSVVYQDSSLAASLDVADNMFLGQELRIGPFVRRRAQRREAGGWLQEMGVEIAPTADLSTLGNAGLQAVEIAKALRTRPKVLILDEPTAALSEREAKILERHLLALKAQNIPLLYVTHRLSEVFALADRVTVLRGGRVVLSEKVAGLDHETLVNAIVGEAVSRAKPRQRPPGPPSAPALAVDNLLAAGIGPVSFRLGAGEVLGVYGLVGSGRTELLETLFGARRAHSGTIALAGEPLRMGRPARAARAGLALVPADRLRKSILGTLAAGDNMLLPSYRALARAGFRSRRAEGEVFRQAVTPLHLSPPRIDLEARRFSGGNQQKLVIARWLNATQKRCVLMLDEPTQGVDVGARRDIYDALSASAQAGQGVLVTSSEPEELMQIAHRVIVLSHGRIVATLGREEITQSRLLSLAHALETGDSTA